MSLGPSTSCHGSGARQRGETPLLRVSVRPAPPAPGAPPRHHPPNQASPAPIRPSSAVANVRRPPVSQHRGPRAVPQSCLQHPRGAAILPVNRPLRVGPPCLRAVQDPRSPAHKGCQGFRRSFHSDSG
ncbi:hypothetical protein NDU88_008476 [Pleurodeles waltl]|uniref:Uncharacterized protein n=1 Tax=Pleurodeles waltl TaxID=8319 RepID=A0AAV7QQT3_PLEWA|nr:hypothetical protein NDU88_008476 [Pleurodeles waltl]